MTRGTVVLGMMLAFAGFTLWTLGDAGVKYLKDYSPFQVSWIAWTCSLIIQFVFHKPLGGLKQTFSLPHQRMHILRGLVFMIPAFLAFIIFAQLPLAVAYAIVFTAPFMTKFFSFLILKEKISPLAWGVSLLGFIGVLIVLRPGWVPFTWPVVLAVISTIFFSLGNVLTRRIGEENMTLLSYNLYIDIPLVALLTAPALIHFSPMPAGHLFLNMLLGVTGLVGMVLVSKAFASAPSRYIAPIHYTQIVWGTIWGVLIFHEYPDMWTLVGSAVIVVAGLSLIFATKLKN